MNKLFFDVTTSQDLWRRLCRDRWGHSVPPTSDYRRHYVQRNAIERNGALKDSVDHQHMQHCGISLLIDVPGLDGTPGLKKCLPLKDAKLRELEQGIAASERYAFSLEWSLPEITNIELGLGACMLWRSDECMCQLVPPREHQDTTSVSTGRAAENPLMEHWIYAQDIKPPRGMELDKTWWYYDGEESMKPHIRARVFLTAPERRVVSPEHDYDADAHNARATGAVLGLSFQEINEQNVVLPVNRWSNVFHMIFYV